MDVGGEIKVLGPGEVYIIPGDVEHWVKAGSSTTRVLDIFSPVREEFKY
jgi:quercetin dioxygenase-like cupin family protein